MILNPENLVYVAETGDNFDKIAQLVDEKGAAVILKNNAPRYILMDYGLLKKDTIADGAELHAVAAQVLSKYIEAFEELANEND